jgi:opacity protein-like surface antigen
MKKFLALTFGLIVSFAMEAEAQVTMNMSSPPYHNQWNGYAPASYPQAGNAEPSYSDYGYSEPGHDAGQVYFDQGGAEYGAGSGCGCETGSAMGSETGCGMGCETDCGTDCGAGCGMGCKTGCGMAGTGCYLKLFGGWTELDDFETFNQQFFVTGEFNNGFCVGGTWGHKIRPLWNMECEFTYRNNTASDLTAQFQNNNPIEGTWDGEVSTYAGMTNLIFESWRPIGRMNPYCGAGAGFGFVDAAASTQFGDYTVDDSGFAYQFIAGVSRQMSCRCAGFVEYRYFSIEDNQVENIAQVVVDDFDYRTHNICFGLRLGR